MNIPIIEVEIQEVVLYGLSDQVAEPLKTALATRLEQLLAAQLPVGLSRDNAAARLDGGVIRLAPGGAFEACGDEIALAVYSSLGGKA